jgi:hypothetical protein
MEPGLVAAAGASRHPDERKHLVKAILAAASLSLLAAAAASAATQPLGAAIAVNACSPPSIRCRQEAPAVAGNNADGFLAVWEAATAADLRGIGGRRFQGAVAATPAFLVNRSLPPDQYDAQVARNKAGHFVVVWSEVANGNSEIMVQRFAAAGTPLGAALKVSVDPPGSASIPTDFRPAVAPTKDGGFVVVWLMARPPGVGVPPSPTQVLLRRFRSNGTPAAAPSQFSPAGALVSDARPGVCVDSNGIANVVWTISDHQRPFESNKTGLSLRRLSAAGAPVGAATTIVPPKALSLEAAISCGTGGNFVVAWHTDQPPAVEPNDVVVQRFNNQGRKVGAMVRVNTTTAGEQRSPGVSHDAKGNFVVVWQQSGVANAIYARRFSAAAAALSPQLEVASEQFLRPILPQVAHTNAGGNFVVLWQSGSRAVFARRYKP